MSDFDVALHGHYLIALGNKPEEVISLTLSTATTIVSLMLEQLLKRVRPPKNRERVKMTLTKSGVVKYDVDSYQRSKAGRKLIADSEALSRTLGLKRVAD